jgi:CRISPR-associated protein Cmr6
MTIIPDPHNHVPMMFQAQVEGRCQLQRLVKGEEPDAVRWADEWVDRIYPQLPDPGEQVQTRTYTINWRLITNSGVDDGVIRPVMGARGWVFYPGSSMKGLFRRACDDQQAERYCGKPVKPGDWAPGILRFQGGYPTDTHWTESLVDVVHPQQAWQTGDPEPRKAGAFAQISLYKPTLRFGISSTIALSPTEWETIWQIWEKAIARGIGSRVCAGYGHVEQGEVRSPSDILLYRTQLRGQGQAPKLLDQASEFRPNIFRAGLRGHALRFFGGLTDAKTAQRLVEQLFGGVSGHGVVGLVGMRFQESQLAMPPFQAGSSYEQTAYAVEGELSLWLAKDLDADDQRDALKKFLEKLVQFAMVLGGFGKSWRRADHRLFFEDYYENDRYKPLIGCHWQWLGTPALRRDVQVRSPEKLSEFIDKVQQTAQDWMRLQGITPRPSQAADWRETWHPQRVQVWGRMADSQDDSEAIHWFHGAYQEKIPGVRPEGSIYKSALVGKVSQVGRLWHRMYPRVRLKPPANPGEKPTPIPTPNFLEFLTIFPDESPECDRFLEFLQGKPFGFEQLWGEDLESRG